MQPSNSGLTLQSSPPVRRTLIATVTFLLLVIAPGAWTQYPGLPPPVMSGSTLGANIRSAATATQNQAAIVRKGAEDWGRRAGWAAYRADNFQQDFANMQLAFVNLRQQFNVLGNLALQLGRPRADNAVAELDAGLNIIWELFTFLQNQFNAGALDHKTIVRTCGALEDAMREWERELRKNTSRMGIVW